MIMSRVERYQHGEPCWTDVQTPDVEAAKTFYASVFGWTFQDLPTPDGRGYAQALIGEDLVSVIAPQNPSQEAGHLPAQWNVYFAADDARGLAQDVVQAGGTVQFGPEDVAGTGVMLFMEPPGGGPTGVWQAGTHQGSARKNEHGAFAWAELVTPQPQAAVAFFQNLFGHQVTEYPQDDGGTYITLLVGGAEVAAIAPEPDAPEPNVPDGDSGRGWQVYFGVSSAAETVLAAVAAGAEVLVEPEKSEDAGTAVATLKDPQGGVFSVVEIDPAP
jgi:predicted enzyme related to lactoylglutathione lyase